jgi:hypothetical protein
MMSEEGRTYYNLMTPQQREAYCRRRGWFVFWDETEHRWIRCEADHPGAEPDLSRLAAHSRMRRTD